MAGALDIFKGGLDLLTSKGKTDNPDQKGIAGQILDLVNPLSKDGKETAELREKFRDIRTGIFGEAVKTILLSKAPSLAATLDVGMAVTGNMTKEVVPWQHEFEVISALLLLPLPEGFKHMITDFFANSEIFQSIVNHFPLLDDEIKQGVKEKDPNAVIKALRYMHQLIVVDGKVGYEAIKGLFNGNPGDALKLGAVGGGLLAGSKLLDGSGSSGGGMIDKIKETFSGGTPEKGKKLTDLIKSHAEKRETAMQTNLLALLRELNVLESAEIIKGKWANNNDEVTISFIYNQKKYFLIFDDDNVKTKLTLKAENGTQLADFNDWGGFDVKDSAKTIRQAIK
jgi:hypothetical protein